MINFILLVLVAGETNNRLDFISVVFVGDSVYRQRETICGDGVPVFKVGAGGCQFQIFSDGRKISPPLRDSWSIVWKSKTK